MVNLLDIFNKKIKLDSKHPPTVFVGHESTGNLIIFASNKNF